MDIVGIVAEYDPFHNGHLYHMNRARQLSGCEKAVCVLSGSFTQRGAPALMEPFSRARAALECGMDAALLLPVHFALREAEAFALGGVSVLERAGATHLAFGCENDDLLLFKDAAMLLEHPDSHFQTVLRSGLDKGLPHPAALFSALTDSLGKQAECLEKPNNTLALCYMRALIRLKSALIPVPVKRGSSHHDRQLNVFPSSSAVRASFFENSLTGLENSLPPCSLQVLMKEAESGRIGRAESMDRVLLYRLQSMKAEELASIQGMSEGLENRILSKVNEASTREELLWLIKTRRYPYARLSRLLTRTLLNITEDETPVLPEYTRLLGFRGIMGDEIKKAAHDIEFVENTAKARSLSWQAEVRSDLMWNTLTGIPGKEIYSRHCICIK